MLICLECNQETKICPDDPNLICHPIDGIYYCCAELIIPSKLPHPNISFVPELQHQQEVPDNKDGNFLILTSS
jgi:hypothetical protein